MPSETPAPTAPAPAAVATGQIVLVSVGEPGSESSGLSHGKTVFTWQYSAEPASGQGYELRVWREGEPMLGAHDAVADNQQGRVKVVSDDTYRLEVDITDAAGVQRRNGEYLWTVLLVQISPQYREMGVQAAPGRLRFEAPGGGGGGGDGGGGTHPSL